MSYTIFETFVGAGGSHIGFKQQGFKSVYVNDDNKDCIDTLLLNNPEIKETAFVDCKSVLDVDINNLLDNIGLKQGELDVMFGGIVCKGFSLAGERSPNDERNYFYHQQLKLVETTMPKISIIENVKAFLNGKVLSQDTPQSIKDEVDSVWQALENYKGQKAELRKKNKITAEFEQKGVELRKQKERILKILQENNYLISVLDDLYQIYDKIGYNVWHKILNTAWYGASTKRERIIIVAVRKDLPNDFRFPIPKYHSGEISTKLDFDNIENVEFLTPISIGQALSQIDYTDKSDVDNQPMNHSPKTVERFKYIKAGSNIQETMHEIPDELKISNFYSRGNTMRLSMDKLAPTLVPGHSNFPVHPTEHRSITVREAAMITGFPLDYKFIGNHSKRCEHVGNAVPPPLANALAKECVNFLDKINKN
ncbi:DNA cytosine methyltransferase [Moraxella cuniculi]|uniref:DNA (cytosine-5-)-methyltransferase n=1 Tax=Moraxella cuniculi TaxID=34061 RepID=A0A3S4RLT0_9GAMM|nr:DNA cytosine methyltransferase [Moraxella cuniculi]VEG13670.1 Modification methylase BspRI [Moraxella cuniculi]